MSTMLRIFRYELRDVLRSRALILYGSFFLVATWLLFRFSSDSAKALLSLANVTLLIVPLVSIILGTMFVYNAREFSELLLAHPVNRRQLFGGLYLGLAMPLSAVCAIAVAVPVLVVGIPAERVGAVIQLLVAAVYLTCIFTAIAFAIALRVEDRVRGIGTALVTWLILCVVYDALALLGANALWAWPLERPLVAVILLNPVDLARVVLMLNFDVSALMGYTGAVFRDFFGGSTGLLVALGALTVWVAVPLGLGSRLLERKDF
jgi:Cu-processing system permease protein